MGNQKSGDSANLIKNVSYLSRSDKIRLKKALAFCNSAHLGQFRRTGDPYSSHPIEVANICASWHLDVEALIAALLHDTVEDTSTSLLKISTNFGGTVTELVDGLSKIDKLVDLISDLKGKNCLVFCHFKEEMDLIKHELGKKNIQSEQYHGGLNVKKRLEIF